MSLISSIDFYTQTNGILLWLVASYVRVTYHIHLITSKLMDGFLPLNEELIYKKLLPNK